MTELHWISDDTLLEIARKCFKTTLSKYAKRHQAPRTDPTLLIALNSLFGFPEQQLIGLQDDIALVKTLQNAIGTFHQEVLGHAKGWSSKGHVGGVFDIESNAPVPLANNRQVVAEVKMRFNTIKSSDECNVWDKLKDASSSRGGASKCVAYLVQIVPKTNEPYDRPWKVSGRAEDDRVRCIDGRSAYHLVTGDPTALDDLYAKLPLIFSRLREEIPDEKIDFSFPLQEHFVEDIISRAFPSKSALAD